MTILLSSQANINDNRGLGSLLSETARDLGILGKPGPTTTGGIASDIEKYRLDAANYLSSLAGRAASENFDPNYVGSGKKTVVGTNVPLGEGNISTLEDASVRKVYTQEPKASVLIKKRAFSSLNHLYDPTLMDSSEKWLFRATKRLFMRKCTQLRDFEMISKIKRLDSVGSSSATSLLSFITNMGSQLKSFDAQVLNNIQQQQIPGAKRSSDSSSNFFTSAFQLEKIARAREPVDLTTWFYEPDLPIIEELGIGSGVFEITLVTAINTNLGIDGSGDASFSLENPYNIMMISESDIEMALRETSLSQLSNAVSTAAGLALSSAQNKDASLQQQRIANGKSEISFTVNAGGNEDVVAIIDAIGFVIDEENLNQVPEGQRLNTTEQQLFIAILKSLKTYVASLKKSFMQGNPVGAANSSSFKGDMRYARNMMRKFYLGRLIIQPMDQVHIFIDSATRQPGEGNKIGDDKPKFGKQLTDTFIHNIGQISGIQDSRQIDPTLLKEAWKQFGKHMKFQDFQKIYTMTEGGAHVFAGLINTASSQYNAESGTFSVSANARSLIEWLSISRYNKQPSIKQTDGIVYDPLTPFKFKTDSATGLPIGRPELTDENKRILQNLSCKQYLPGGKKSGKLVNNENDLNTDFVTIGGALYPIYDMPYGLKYRWKEGIVTITYNMSTVDPLDKTKVNERQLRRDVGLFTTNTPFASMDVANIVSTLVTGFPYNPATFVSSALNTGNFSLDTSLNNRNDYFQSLLDIQKSINLTHGNWTPFKRLTTNRDELAFAILYQKRLTEKSSKMQQLRNQLAQVEDEILRTEVAKKQFVILGDESAITLDALRQKRFRINYELIQIEDEFTKDLSGKNVINSDALTLKVAGNDIIFDLVNPKDKEDVVLLGDELTFVTQRRRENIIFNKDKNLFIVSDEYDKDFDIQAFNIQMAGNSFNLWKSTWEPVLGLCKRAAEIIDFEFFVNTQGHLELRPPQYNRTPVSVLNAMLTYDKTTGIRLFPDFLEKLVLGKTDGLIRDIKTVEWEIKKELAILGLNDNEIASVTGIKVTQFLINGAGKDDAANEQLPTTENQKERIKDLIQDLNVNKQKGISQQTGIFSANKQLELQRDRFSKVISTVAGSDFTTFEGAQQLFSKGKNKYDEAIREISKLTGKPAESFPEFDAVKVGISKNGVVSPTSDIAAATNRMSRLVSRRARLLGTLSRSLDQAEEIIKINEDGGTSLVTGGNFGSSNNFGLNWNKQQKNNGLYKKLISDDQENILGHLSGRRLIIDDEVLLSSNFQETVPEYTICSVQGTDPFVGEKLGNSSSGLPIYTAIGVDFDLWRQYGFRSEKPFEKPFLWSAEQQCAPYAKMLLTRQRANIVTGNVSVIGNEFYQLGDVVYVADRQMLYYVNRIRHSFSYDGDGEFNTTLDLNYGHPPGEYIPTPLDIIGKSLSNRNNIHTEYRTRRFGPGMGPSQDNIIATVKFPIKSNDVNTDISDLLSHATGHGKRNFEILTNALRVINDAKNRADKKENRPKVVVSYFGQSTKGYNMVDSVVSWLQRPRKGGSPADVSFELENETSWQDELMKLRIDIGEIIVEGEIIPYQCQPEGNFSSTDRELLRQGVTAGSASYALDNTLESVVEIRLRQPPSAGWSLGEQ